MAPRALIRALSIAVAALLVAGGAGVAVHHRSDALTAKAPNIATPTTGVPPTTAVTGTTPTLPPALAAAIADIERFVERTRGLSFTRPVPVSLLGDAAFRAKVAELSTPAKDELDKAAKVLWALGLLDRSVDLAKAQSELLGAAVLGLYDPKSKSLFVRGGRLSPLVRSTLAHELTHAVQDQHFGVDRPDLDKRDDEASTGFTSLVEGDAVRVETLFEKAMSAKDRAELQREQASSGGAGLAGIPPVLVELLVFPYRYGPSFTSALVKQGGQARLDAAFGTPPTTSEQIEHPERFLAGDGPKAVAEPAPGAGKVIDRGVLGEEGLQLLTGLAYRSDESAATTAAAGWGGDRYVATESNGRICLRAAITMDTRNDQNELRAALDRLATARTGYVTVTGDDPVQLETCG